MTHNAGDYAFPHANTGESRRLDLFAERLDPVTKRRIGQLGLARPSAAWRLAAAAAPSPAGWPRTSPPKDM